MKKTILLSLMALIVISISSFAQIVKVMSHDNDIKASACNLSVMDQDTLSRKNQNKQYSLNPIYQKSIHPVIMINGKVSGYGSSIPGPNYYQYISALKSEKRTAVYRDINGSGVIIVTSKKRPKENKVENELIKK